MNENPKWREFELLAASIQKKLAPEATVTHNDSVMGKRSHTKRQIDISVRQKIGQYDLFIAVDCKDYKRRVDIPHVEEFMGLVEDISANKGAMISARGFTKAALARAMDAGIDTYTLIDAQNQDWRQYIALPALNFDRSVARFNFEFRGTGFVRISVDPRMIQVHRANGEYIDIVYNIFTKRWNEDDLPDQPGRHEHVPLWTEPAFLKTDGILCPVEIHVSYSVEQEICYWQLPVEEMKGLRDENTGTVYTQGFITKPVTFDEVRRNGRTITNEEALSVTPVLRFYTRGQYPLWDEGAAQHMK